MSANFWKFSELKYAKPDLRVYVDIFNDAIKRVEEAQDGDEVVQVILELDETTRRADDLVRLAFIHGSLDTKNPYYKEQQRWFDENLIYYDQAIYNFREAVYNSPFRSHLEAIFGTAYFIDADIQRKTFAEECIELYQRENELCTEYQELIEWAEVELRGRI